MNGDIRTFLALLRELQKIDPEFPLHYAVCLAEIALNEGLSLTELAARTNLALSTVSRIVGALSQYRQKGQPYKLVKVTIDPRERRRKRLSLTPRGHAVVNGLAGLIGSAGLEGRRPLTRGERAESASGQEESPRRAPRAT